MLLILDFNHCYTSVVAMKLRAEGVQCRILPGDSMPSEVLALKPLGLVLAGSIGGDIPLTLDGRLLSAGIPVLALGDTAASVCLLLNGQSGDSERRDAVETVRFQPSPITEELSASERMISAVRPLTLPEDLLPLARIDDLIVGFKHRTLSIYGLGFQMESNDQDGNAILLHFARKVCGCTEWWNESAFISATRSEISSIVGSNIAVCLVTGGLDSGVNAVIAHRALGERLKCIYVDTGLLREQETERFLSYYYERENLNIIRVNAQGAFMEALKGLTEPEEKRRAIRQTLKEEVAAALTGVEYQVVIRATTCENILTDPERQSIVPVEGKTVLFPFKDIFREEVRYIGEKLGMPSEMLGSQPFPQTGLALRIEGETSPKRLSALRRADAIFCEEVVMAGLHKRLWKYYALLQKGQAHAQSSADVIVLRAVSLANTHLRGMCALPARLPYDLLERYVERVRQACPEIAKVMYDVTPGNGYADAEWR